MAEKPRQVVPSLGALPQIQPQAQPKDSYVRPGQTEYGKPAATNPMLQLSQALANLEPTLLQATSMVSKQYGEEEYAKGEKEFWENREKWNSMIRAGQLPEGASPYFVRGLQRASVKQLGDEFVAAMSAAFYGPDGADARQSDNPQVMTNLLNTVRKKFTDEKLKNGDKHLYQPLDVQEVFNPLAEHGYWTMMQTHAQYRVHEREKEFEATASAEIGNKLSMLPTMISSADSDDVRKQYLDQVGREVNDVLYNQDYGIVKNGMSPTKGNQLLVDTVVAKAESTGDRSYLDVLDHIKNKDGAPIGKTQYAMAKRTAAEEHLTSLQMQKEHFAHWKAGLPFEEMSRAHTMQEWQRQDARYEREVAGWKQKDAQIATEEVVTTLERRIFEGLRRDATTGPKIIDDAMQMLEKTAPEKAAYMRGVIHTITKQKTDYDDDPLTVAQLRVDMNTDPLGFKNDRLVQAVKEQKLKSSTMLKMMDDLERNRQNADHPFLRQPDFLGMLDQVKKGALRNAGDEYGAEGALRAADSTGDFRDLALEWIEKNPQGSPVAFRNYMRSQIRDVIERNNIEYAAEQRQNREQQEKAGKTIRDVTGAEVRQKELDAEDENRQKDDQKKQLEESQKRAAEELKRLNEQSVDTGRKTSEGRKILRLPDGSSETEGTITVKDPRINDGRPTNIPTIYGGKHYSDKEAKDIIVKNNGVDPDTGRKLRGYYSQTDAEIAARERSARLGKEYGQKPEPTITPQHLRTLMTNEQKKEIAELRNRVINPGVDVKPATQEELKDAVVRILKPIYKEHGAGLDELTHGVEEFMRALLPQPKPKK
ncbi:MAG: hypothetical protein A4E20_01460 [Nitrospira sp. SG-bin2]|uniref:hypothetical protein n=1 Tax=Nitrospira cf. moscoviensis SBR1015 TaxID=96242 RepID=UPI000A0D483C|nr:hypothetical protein [Nitrospira cf. moscoviensis SBR1015]OQW34872.1 MAG: hypothetical protein A4E20_01460 [Nitrospira sp. SG-bin2]